MPVNTEPSLFTFAISHYCEKARWALDVGGIAFAERCWAPGPHILLARKLAPGTSVPILAFDDHSIQGSDKILDWIEREGLAAWSVAKSTREWHDITEAEALADTIIGPQIRRLFYAASLMDNPIGVRDSLVLDVPAWQRTVSMLLWPNARKIMIKQLDLSPTAFDEARAALDTALVRIDRLVSNGGTFLVDNRWTRADLTTASLLAPLVDPPEHPMHGRVSRGNRILELRDEWALRPSLQWVAEQYRTYRTAHYSPLEAIAA